jgi:hypothetical protein
MARVEEFKDRIPPEVEQRVEQAVQTFRENHKDPANIALHAVGYYAIATGLLRIVGKHKFRGMARIGFGVGMLLAGHNIEGTPAFSMFSNGQKR